MRDSSLSETISGKLEKIITLNCSCSSGHMQSLHQNVFCNQILKKFVNRSWCTTWSFTPSHLVGRKYAYFLHKNANNIKVQHTLKKLFLLFYVANYNTHNQPPPKKTHHLLIIVYPPPPKQNSQPELTSFRESHPCMCGTEHCFTVLPPTPPPPPLPPTHAQTQKHQIPAVKQNHIVGFFCAGTP